MVSGWRRAFCTTIPKDRQTEVVTEKQQQRSNNGSLPSPQINTKFGFFSNPSTPRLQSQLVSSPSLRCRTTTTVTTQTASIPDDSPKLQCKTPRFFQRSNPSSPRSPSSFSLLRTSLRLNKSRCGICSQSVKTGQGTAIFTAECSHAFHFPCIAVHFSKQGILVCPVCSAQWKEVPLLAIHKNQKPEVEEDKNKNRISQVKDVRTNDYRKQYKPSDLKVYNDDEPLMSPTAGGRFNPIPESDENDDENGEENGTEEFQGFFVNTTTPKVANETVSKVRNIDVNLLPEAAVVSVGRSCETYALVLKVKAPSSQAANDGKTSSLLNPARRAPIDLVTVIDASGSMTGAKLQMMKRAMRLVISSLSSNDRLSIVAFSATSKRLLPLRRMTVTGKRSARRIVDALGTGQGNCAGDALLKAAKVLEDRRERNPVATIMLLSDGHDERRRASSAKSSNQNRPASFLSSTRFVHLNIPIQSTGFGEGGAYGNAPTEDAFAKYVGGLLSVVVQDLRLQLGFTSGSSPAEIAAVYTCTGRPMMVGPGSIRLGDLYAEEEREFMIELKVPSSAIGSHSHHVLAVRSTYKDPSSQEIVYGKEQALLVPRPHAVRLSSPNIERLRNLFVTTRAVAESRRRLVEHNDISGAHHLLSSARALLMQSSSAEEYLRGLESELAELNWRRQQLQVQRQRNTGREGGAYVDEKGEPLTPTSAWRAAERLAKVAIMRKSLNRVSDLHGFENARF